MEIVVKQKRAAAYCRVSTGMECQEGSYEIQKSYFTELLSNNPDEELVKVYADEGSGRSTQGRPEFRQMIQDCMDGKIDIIYTKSISRFSRNMLDCVTVVRRLKELGIPVIFEKEGINTMNGRASCSSTSLPSLPRRSPRASVRMFEQASPISMTRAFRPAV